MSYSKPQVILQFLIIIVLTTHLISSEITTISSNTLLKDKAKSNTINLLDNLHKQIKAKEDELKEAELVNKNFERMIQLVNILGQVDSFITERTKAVIKKLAALAENDNNNNNSI